MRVAVIQMVSGSDLAKNFQQAKVLVEEASRGGAELVVLPENFLTYGQAAADVKALQDVYLPQIRALSKDNGLYLVAGTIPFFCEKNMSQKKPYASSFVFSPDGEELFRYDKIHLFDAEVADATGAYRESDTYAHGSTIGSLDCGEFTLGLSVCYDLRFPEYYRLLSQAGASVVCVPSAFTYVTGEAHWEVLLRARAIENQCFIVAANQGGVHDNGRETYGHSMIVSPWGEVLASSPKGECCTLVDIDLHEIKQLQKKMPVHKHRVF